MLQVAGEGAGVIYEATPVALTVFLAFVALTLGLSIYLARRTHTSAGFYAAHGVPVPNVRSPA